MALGLYCDLIDLESSAYLLSDLNTQFRVSLLHYRVQTHGCNDTSTGHRCGLALRTQFAVLIDRRQRLCLVAERGRKHSSHRVNQSLIHRFIHCLATWLLLLVGARQASL